MCLCVCLYSNVHVCMRAREHNYGVCALSTGSCIYAHARSRYMGLGTVPGNGFLIHVISTHALRQKSIGTGVV